MEHAVFHSCRGSRGTSEQRSEACIYTSCLLQTAVIWSVICKSADKKDGEDISVVCHEFLGVQVTPAAVRLISAHSVLNNIITVDYALVMTVEMPAERLNGYSD